MLDEGVFMHDTIDITTSDVASDTYELRHKVPLDCTTERIRVDTLRNVDTFRLHVNIVQWSLDAIKDGAHNAGAKFHRKWLARSQHRIADGNTS